MTSHLFRGGDFERARARSSQLDPIIEGQKHRLAPEVSLAIWERVRAELGRDGEPDEERAQQRFHQIARRVAARRGQLGPVPGRVTRLEAWGADPDGNLFADLAPGRTTHVLDEARRWERRDDSREVDAPRPDQAKDPTASRPGEMTPLDATVGARMSQLFGVDLTRVAVAPASPAATGATKAVTKDGEVHFRAGAYQPGTPDGDWLIAHELAHVVQQRGGRGERAGTTKQLEREADRAATLAARGRAAPIALRAQASAAYAFNEGEAHDADVDEVADHQGDAHADAGGGEGAKADAKPDDHAEAAHGPAADHDETADHGATAHAGHDDAATHADADHDAPDTGGDDVSAVLPAEASAAAAAPGGGGAAAKPLKPTPSLGATKPEVGLGQLRGVRPDRISLLFGQMHTAASAEAAKARAAQQANPPKQMSTGAAAGPAAAKPKDGAPPPAADPKAAHDPKAAKDVPDHPVKAEVPGIEAAKQAKQAEAAAQHEAITQVVAAVKRSITAWFSAWSGHGDASADAKAPKMSESETRQMAGAVDKLPTSVADVSTEPGPAPDLAMKREAKGTADKDRADLEKTTAGLETLGRADSRAPMGEDHIDPTAAPQELTATPPAPVAGPDAALPTVAGAAASEEVGIVAQEQHGAEIDAALTKASTDVTAERAKETQAQSQARTAADAQIHDLKAKADADQGAARAAAQAEVQQARGQWQAEIDKKGADARKQGDKKVAEGMAQVEAEEAKANAEAREHIDEGKRKADEEKQKGEKEAADAKAKGKSKSSGFWGWVSSKAKAAFDSIKKAVSSAIDACRRAVKAVIAAAKKLAMAVIELARKVIVGVIKAVGKALLAISDVLLAAFPALKARFQNAIRKTVDRAVAAVNRLADGLKQAVQKALDRLGAALDKALQLLERGINAIIDAANAVVQGAIKAAQAVVAALGTWARLIKDVVTGPGAWIGKLGAAIVDGIKNHLWTAFKTAVVEWFKSKVFELLGIGGLILELLLEGGLTREHIIQMALDALMVAIPAALVAILIEKLVAMIVPAAGALMAIIEGLQAAWGTISRIVAAFAAFMAFLLAVKSGGAGPLFATVLASAAIVVLDFVSTWVLRKLASAARKVGARLKGLAAKFKGRRKAKQDAKTPKKHHDEHDGKTPKQHDDHEPKQQKKQDENKQAEKRADAQKRLDAARGALKAYLKQPRGRLALKAKLLQLKLRYRLKELSLQISGNRAQIHGRINPEFIEYADAEVIVSNDGLTAQAQSEGLVSFFRSMSLAELKKIVATGRLTTKSNKGKPTSEMMLAEQNFFASHAQGDLGKGYSIDLIERKNNTKGSKGYDYAILVKIDVLRSAKTNVLLNPKHARLHAPTTQGNEEVLEKQGVDLGEVKAPIAPGDLGVVMLKVESNRGTAVAAGGQFEKTKVMNYSIRPVDPEGLLEGDPLAEFNKKIYRITLIGGGIGRKEIVFL